MMAEQLRPNEPVNLKNAAWRDGLLLSVAGIVGGVAVCGLALANPAATGDELGTVVAVPMMLAYVLARLLGAIAHPLTDQQRARLRTAGGLIPAVYGVTWVVMMLFVVTSLSLGSYQLLGLAWALPLARDMVRVLGVMIGFSFLAIYMYGLLHRNRHTITTMWHDAFVLCLSGAQSEIEYLRALFKAPARLIH